MKRANIETDGAKWFLQHIKVLKLNLNRDGYTSTPSRAIDMQSKEYTQIQEYISYFLHRIKLNIT